MFYLYILKSLGLNKIYKGVTKNIDRRLKEHFGGQCQTTRHMRPLILIHVEICENQGDALKLEKYFKSGFGREIIQELAEVAKLADALP